MQTTEKGHRVKSYIYGYNYNYLVAEIEGVNYSASTSGMNIGLLQNYTDLQLKNHFSSLRSTLTDGFVNSFTYVPLVGMSSQTDPKGLLTSYVYDPIGRLEIIKDYQDRIVKKIDYLMTGKTTTLPSTPYYVNVPIMESFNKTCVDASIRYYNYIYPGGLQSTSFNQWQADYAAGLQIAINGAAQSINCASSTPLAKVTIGTDFSPLLPWPVDLSMDLFKDGNLEVSIKSPTTNLTVKELSFPAGTYTVAWKQNDNYNRSIIMVDIDSSEGLFFNVRSGDVFTFSPGVTYSVYITSHNFN